jgi:thiaminase
MVPAPRRAAGNGLPPSLNGAAPSTAALQAAAVGSPAATAFSVRLITSHSGLWAGLAAHPWITAVAGGSLPPGAFALWCQQRQFLLQLQGQAVAALRACNPPWLVDGSLHELGETTIHQRRQLSRTLADIGAAPADEAAAVCLGYGSYLRCCAAGGLPAGLTALYTAQRASLQAWSTIPAAETAGTARETVRAAWAGDQAEEIVDILAASANQIATPGSPEQEHHLLAISRNVLRCEDAFLRMCCCDPERATEPGSMSA